MEIRPALQIQTIIKAMVEDVIPALDPTNQLAMQSAQLTIGTLSLMAQQLPLQYRYDCDELSRLLAATESLGGAELKAARAAGAGVLARAMAEPSEVLDAVHRLRAAMSEAVRAVYAQGSEAEQAAAEKTVLAMSKEQLLRDRSWLLMQGWEPDPKAVPAIDSLLAPLGAG